MNYVMSDLHGCYEEFKSMLKKIQFKDTDTLYIIGDIIDRGPNGIQILKDIMYKPNIIPILGNHELYAQHLLEIAYSIEQSEKDELDNDIVLEYQYWMLDGGAVTISQFEECSIEEKQELLSYLNNFALWKLVEVNQKKFLLVHAGLSNFNPNRSLDSYKAEELVYERFDYDNPFVKDWTIISGHTPTVLLQPGRPARIFHHKNHIVIDCGVTFGGRLACLCLETMEEFYVDSLQYNQIDENEMW